MSQKRKNRKRKVSTWEYLENLFGEKAVALIIKGKLVELSRGEKRRYDKKESREHNPLRLPKVRDVIDTARKGFERIVHGRPPLPEGVVVRERHKRDIGFGDRLMTGTEIDIFGSLFSNSSQECHTHTIVFDDESATPRNLLIYDRGLGRNRYLICPGKKCKKLKDGEEAEIGPFLIPCPSGPRVRKGIVDNSPEADELRKEIAFDADQELLEWRSRDGDYSEFERDTWQQMRERDEQLMEKNYAEYRDRGMQPNPDSTEP